MTYCNEHNNWVYNSKVINQRPCPNCKSTKYRETISYEYCPDCGLECDYWGKGANSVYRGLIEKQWEKEEQRRKKENQSYLDKIQPPKEWKN